MIAAALEPKISFDHILSDYIGVVRKVCNLYADSSEEYEDFYQECMLQIWKSHQNFRGEAKASTWVYRVALNVCLTQLKLKKRKVDNLSLDQKAERLAWEPYDTTRDEQVKTLYSAIRKLKELDRAIIMLYLEEKSYDEISEVMGLTMSNVGVRINRIKKQLTQLINGR